MRLSNERRLVLMAIPVLALAGCAGGEAKPTTPPVAEGSKLKPEVAQTPEKAVEVALTGLKSSHPVVVWDLMATADQHNYNKFVRDLAELMDAEVWNQTASNLKKLAKVMETKKDFILASPFLKTKSIDLKSLAANWGPLVQLVKTVTDSELLDKKKMEQFDGRKFLEGTGAKLLDNLREITKAMKDDPMKRIDSLKVVPKALVNDTASVELQSPNPKDKPFQLSMQIHDGRWTVNNFAQLMILLQLRKIGWVQKLQPYGLAEWKDDYLNAMKRLDKGLDALAASKTSADFQAEVARSVLPVAIRLMAMRNAKSKLSGTLLTISTTRPANTALVLVTGEHDNTEPRMVTLTAALKEAASSKNGSFSGPSQAEGNTFYLVGGVSRPNELAKSFGDAKVSLDEKRNMATLEVPHPEKSAKPPAGEKDAKSADASGSR